MFRSIEERNGFSFILHRNTVEISRFFDIIEPSDIGQQKTDISVFFLFAEFTGFDKNHESAFAAGPGNMESIQEEMMHICTSMFDNSIQTVKESKKAGRLWQEQREKKANPVYIT